jgi:Lecithin:cholesterol acyltransferase
MVAATYDFRLPPMLLERRDHFFTRLIGKFERLVAMNNNIPAIVISHSLGGKVFGYFVEFVKATKPHVWQQWVRW